MWRVRKWLRFERHSPLPFKILFARFHQILEHNTELLRLFADAVEKQSGEYVFDRSYLVSLVSEVFDTVNKTVYDLNSIADQKYAALYTLVDRLRAEAQGDLSGQPSVPRTDLCVSFDQIDESRVNLVGGKSAHLGAIRNRLQVRMPDGFTITTYAYLRVVEENRLQGAIEAALERLARGDDSGQAALVEQLRYARIPADVRRAISRALTALERDGGAPLLAVRSSALGEDEDESFAGQYRTVLQVRPEGVLDAYREVLASLYAKAAIAYRRARGLAGQGLMAVACMRMVQAESSGVVYTVDPNRPRNGRLLIGAVDGLANRAVAGLEGMTTFELARDAPHAILDWRPATGAGGDTSEAVPPLGAATELAETALKIERYFKQPQDIEWARDATGTVFVIQARRLQVHAQPELPRRLPEALRDRAVLIERRGYVVCRGVAHGPVWPVEADGDLDGFPAGAVLVAHRSSPKFARVMPRAAAILTDIGAPTGHMAALAREFRVPTIVDCGDATARLPRGQEVTIDADDNKVYAGRVEELLQYQLVTEGGFEDSKEYRILRRLLRRITPLTLVDPQSDDFRAERCRTVHDVIRFAHEKAVEELIDLHSTGGVSGTERARRLESDLPLGLVIIDVGAGLDPADPQLPATSPVRPEAIRSFPMRALWEGLTTPGAWSTRPVHVDLRTFMASAMSRAVTESAGRNLAVVSEHYANLSLNLGYHYNMVDAYLSDDRDANHVYFRFVGGAADVARRIRRATMVREVLERLDFGARQHRDLVVARLRKLPPAETADRLRTVGRLIAYTRQMDALMINEDEAMRHVGAFLAGDYSLE